VPVEETIRLASTLKDLLALRENAQAELGVLNNQRSQLQTRIAELTATIAETRASLRTAAADL